MADELPGLRWNAATGLHDYISAIDAWLDSQGLCDLIEAFDGRPPSLDQGSLAIWLEEFARVNWNRRATGEERLVAHDRHLTLRQVAATERAATSFGMVDAKRPIRMNYDATLVLGGLIRACIVRPRFAASLVRRGLVLRNIVGLSAFRPLALSEVNIAESLGLRVDNEFDALTEGMRVSFGFLIRGDPHMVGDRASERAFSSWQSATWRTANSATETISVLAAPSGEPLKRRAHSAETYAFWADHLRNEATRSVLVITHPIYAIYQGAAAIDVLGIQRGLDVETVGISNEAADLGQLTQRWHAEHYLQEIYSSIRAVVALRRKLAAGVD
jgi:hypothetical protein